MINPNLIEVCPEVVVIEDDPDIRESIIDVLSGEGYSVHGYANGKAALEGLQGCKEPCIILLDLMMPVMNGQEFLAARKTAGDKLMAIPVVIVSAYVDTVRNEDGVIGYVKKPIDIDLLLNLVEQKCRECRHRNEVA